jgi:four helix bundle protein
MTDIKSPARSRLPHHHLVAYAVATQLLIAVRDAAIRDTKLRDQALRAAKSACLNIAEATGRATPADKARVYGIVRGETVEAAAAVEIAELAGDATTTSADHCIAIADRLYALLTGLMR